MSNRYSRLLASGNEVERKDRPKNVESNSKNKFEALMHLVGFAIEIYYDVRLYERQIS